MSAPLRAALYCRVSSHTSTGDDPWASLPRQEEKLRQLAERDGHHVAMVYQEVYTGVRSDRAEFQDLLGRIGTGEIQAVYVVAFDRLTRNGDLGEVEALRREFVRLGADVITPNEVWRFSDHSADSPEAKLNFRMRGVLAGWDRDIIERRLTDGRDKKARSGGDYGGPTPYGYRATWDAGSGAKRFEVDEEQAEVVRRIYREYLEGSGYKVVAAGLNRSEVPGPNGGRWDTSAVRYILRNAVYAGLTEYLKPWRRHRIKSRGATAVVPSLVFPAILDMATMEAARERMQERKTRPRLGVVDQHPLSGLLRCDGCGCGLVISYTRKRAGAAIQRYYVCRSLKDPRLSCETPSRFPYDEAHRAMLATLRRVLPRAADEHRRQQSDQVRSPEEQRELDDARRALAKLEAEEVELTRLLGQKTLSPAAYGRALQPIEAEAEAHRARIERIERGAETRQGHEAKWAAVASIAEIVGTVKDDDPKFRDLASAIVQAAHLERSGRDPKDRRRIKLRVSRLQLVTGDWIDGRKLPRG